MREILSLMFPIHFRGNIYHKAAMFICLPFLLTVGALSIWSNLHGVESFFGSLPPWALAAAKVAVVFIDPVNWLCLTLLIVSVVAFAASEKLEKLGQLERSLVRSLKPKLVLASIVLTCLVCALTYATFLLSDTGAEKGADEYVDATYKPEIGLDSIVQAHKQTHKQDVSSIQAAYTGQISDLRSRLGAAQKAKAASADWNKGKPNWAKYNDQQAAKKEIAAVQALMEQAYAAIEKKESEALAVSNELLEARKASYNEAADQHATNAELAKESMWWAVRSWTLLGLLIQLVSCVLTFDLYQRSAYAFLGQEVRAHDDNIGHISDEINRISRDKQYISSSKQTTEKPSLDESEPPKRLHTSSNQRLAPTQAESDEDSDIIEQIRARHSHHWLIQWKHALTDERLTSESKANAAKMFGCSLSTIDNLRRAKTSLASFVPDSGQLKRILEKI